MTVALVAVEGSAYHYDKPYSYSVPTELTHAALPGSRVVVPFGRGDRTRRGVILECKEENAVLKPILRVVDDQPLIGPEMLRLARFVSERTFCTLYDALRLTLPAGLGMKMELTYRLNPELPPAAFAMLAGDEAKIGRILASGPLERGKLLARAGLDGESDLPDAMARRGVLLAENCAVETPNEASVRMARPAVTGDEAEQLIKNQKLTPKQKRTFSILLEAGSATVRELCYFAGVTPAVITALQKKGAVELYAEREFRSPYEQRKTGREEPPSLSPAQREAYSRLLSKYEAGGASAALLYGVTGSGKTQVFMKLIERVRRDGRGVIVLVPEISLTPQAVTRFYSRFGDDVAVLHSGLSVGERLDEWQRLRDGKANIAVGTRSAVFAPVENLGLIVIDEEQEHTYKSESSPRYHARDVARFRCADADAMLLLASATPSVESFHAAKEGRYELVRLNERFGEAELPRVIAADMKKELVNGNEGPLSSLLLGELNENIRRGEQSILLLNRRGFSTFVYCADCGQVLSCPNCSISLTWHSANRRLMCHYCGYSAETPESCPKCGGRHMRYSGSGTQKAEEALESLLPQARILRMDADTTLSKYAHEKILDTFEKEHCDILIGTQMVAKGLDFPDVTLVGILSADQSLYMDDFRAAERTFSLLTQVIGRSGRGSRRGRAVIQTGTPENEVILLASRQDYDAFYESEIELRRQLLYPPFCDICQIGFSGPDERAVSSLSRAFYGRLGEEIRNRDKMPLRVMEPSPAGIYRVGGRYRYKIILKCRNSAQLREMTSSLLREFGQKAADTKTAVFADLNPLTVL